MIELKRQTADVVASDTQSAASAIDQALLHQLRLCATVLEASEESKLAMRTTQRVLEPLSAGFQKIVEGRAQMTVAVRELSAIQGRSNLRETFYGCPGGPIAQAAEDVRMEAID